MIRRLRHESATCLLSRAIFATQVPSSPIVLTSMASCNGGPPLFGFVTKGKLDGFMQELDI